MWIAVSSAEGTILVSATGAVVLAALLAFGFWWFKPFRSDSRAGARLVDPPHRDGDRDDHHGDEGT